MSEFPQFYNSIPQSWDYLSRILICAYKDRSHALRTMNIAYSDINVPYCRTVVLRECADDISYIQFHTDYRSPKVHILQENPQIAVNLYSPIDKIQLSINGTAKIHHKNNIAQKAWHKTQFLSRKCYLAPNPPSVLNDMPVEYYDHNKNTFFETEFGYYNFAVIRIDIKTIDFLYLHIHNNRRILFSKDTQSNKFNGKWFNP